MKEFDFSKFELSANELAEQNATYKKENNISSKGLHEQRIYTKKGLDMKAIEKKIEIAEKYDKDTTKHLRVSLRKDCETKLSNIIRAFENKFKSFDNDCKDFASFYANCYLTHSFKWSDCLLNNANQEKKDLFQKGLNIFADWCNKQK